jgi:Tol biopolymer transport system component
MQFTPDGKKLVLMETQENYFIIYDIESDFNVLSVKTMVKIFDDWVNDFSISPDGSKIIACDKDDLYTLLGVKYVTRYYRNLLI